MKNSNNLSSTNAIVNEILMKRANKLLEFMLSNPPFLEVVSRFSNLLMDLERGIFLRNLDPASDNKANGYYERNLACSLGNLNLKVPRDRLGDFRSFILHFAYIKYLMEIRRYLNNTKTVESVNSILETIRRTSEGHFQSIDTAMVSIYVITKKLKNNKWSKGIPAIKSSRYEIMQMFNSRFQTQKS